MVQAAHKGFGPRIANVFEDPRSHIVYEDAKTFFASVREPYDLIVSEPSNPWVSGVATLFSDEFYARIAQYLKPDGYLVQWIQVYETDLGVVASIVKAMAPHFGAYAIYNSNDSDIVIVATRGSELPIPDDRIFQSPQLRAELGRIGVQGVDDLRLRKIGDNRTIGPILQSMAVPPNSDFFPFVDLNAPRLRFMRADAGELPGLTALPIPFLELLPGAVPRGPTSEPSGNTPLARAALVRRAFEIRRAVSDGSLNNLDSAAASDLLLIDTGRDGCADAGTQNAWKIAVRNITDFTAAYLSPAELEEIWNRISSSPCYRVATAEQRTWVDLLRSISRRDASETVKFAAELLKTQAPTSEADLAYLTTVTAAAYIHMGQIEQAHNLLAEQSIRLDHSGEYHFPLLNLQALTQADPPGALAQVRP